MPLPTTDTAWPPKRLEPVTPVLARWSAWWTGDPAALTSVYRVGSTLAARPSQLRGGVVGALARFWWGRPPTTGGQQRNDLTHVPLAADIARTSADLLFSEPPTIRVSDAGTQGHVDDTLADPLFATLTGAAEAGAALGGVYVRVTWDATVADHAFPTVVAADEAVPEFAWGRLRAVTFWHVVERDGTVVWRHLERHELGLDGVGLIQHGLYEGTETQLGRPIPLVEKPATAPLATAVDADGYVTAGRTPGLAVVYVPNTDAATAKAWRHVPAAGGLGAADIDGVEPLLDNLDEIHAAWMRDIRLAKARLVVARYMLDDNGPGAGASMDLDREVFAPLKMAAGEDGDSPITPVQFKIRFEEHRATAQEWSDRIVQSAGYSVQTFGEQGETSQTTATEVMARESRSLKTRGRKLRLWRPALTELVEKLLTVDAAVFGKRHDATDLKVTFPDGIWETPLQAAQTASALRTAEAASTETLVGLVHPDWDDDRIKAEAAAILRERGVPVNDPFAITE